MRTQFFFSPIHPSWGFYAAICGALIGLSVGVFWNLAFCQSLGVVAVSIILILVGLKFCCRFTLVLLLLLGILLGNFRVSQDLLDRGFLAQFYNQTVSVIGRLDDDPDEGKVRLSNLSIYTDTTVPVENFLKTVENSVEKSVGKSVENFQQSGAFRPVAGTLYITLANKKEDLARSDQILLQGKLSDGFGTFVGKMSRPKLLLIQRANPGDLFAQFKRWFAERVRQLIPSPQVDLGLGYLMGMKTGDRKSVV